MLDVAWPELVVVGIVALVAIGPKDLPKALYTMGKWAGKARGMVHDLRRAFEQVSYEAEVAENLKKSPATPPSETTSPAPADKHDPA